jgi:hypothetical protein
MPNQMGYQEWDIEARGPDIPFGLLLDSKNIQFASTAR